MKNRWWLKKKKRLATVDEKHKIIAFLDFFFSTGYKRNTLPQRRSAAASESQMRQDRAAASRERYYRKRVKEGERERGNGGGGGMGGIFVHLCSFWLFHSSTARFLLAGRLITRAQRLK